MNLKNTAPFHNPILGISLKLSNCLCFTFISIIAKLTLTSCGKFQLFFMSIGVSCLLLLPYMMKQGFPIPNKAVWPHYIALGILGIFGMTLWFHVLTILPIAYATALSYTTPLFTTVLAILFLKEKLKLSNTLTLIIGFCGALFVVNPKMPSAMLWGSLLVIINALIWASYDVITKLQTVREKPLIQTFYVLVLHFIVASPFALTNWESPSSSEYLGSLGIGILFILNLLALFNAYKYAPLSLLMPFSFFRILFAITAGWLIWKEIPQWQTIIGCLIIFLCTSKLILYTAYKQKTKQKN